MSAYLARAAGCDVAMIAQELYNVERSVERVLVSTGEGGGGTVPAELSKAHEEHHRSCREAEEKLQATYAEEAMTHETELSKRLKQLADERRSAIRLHQLHEATGKHARPAPQPKPPHPIDVIHAKIRQEVEEDRLAAQNASTFLGSRVPLDGTSTPP
eukprot:Sspe_Gene.24017::Locus_9434_Transcript_1_1_Confidence_1.000_Length_665::g.24017::m.24017